MSLTRGDIRPLTDDQIDHILNSADNRRAKALIFVLAQTGCRLAEALSLRWNDIHADSIVIPWLKRRGARRGRTLPIMRARLTLRVWLRDQDAERLWPVDASTAWRWIKAAGAAAGLDHIHPHALRHSFACNWLRRGGDLARLQHWLGHSSLATTSIYLHSEPADLLREAQRIGMIEPQKPHKRTPNHPRLPQGKRASEGIT